jgi:hypothetical protein
MSRGPKKCAFAEALLAMLDEAILLAHHRQEWFSATFVGERHMLALKLMGDDAMQKAEAFAQVIPEHEFTLPRLLVADIAVSAIQTVDGGVELMVEALLLEE